MYLFIFQRCIEAYMIAIIIKGKKEKERKEKERKERKEE